MDYDKFAEEIRKISAVGDLWLHWDQRSENLSINLNLDQQTINSLNSNAQCQKVAREALVKVYRYRGKFAFDIDDIPF